MKTIKKIPRDIMIDSSLCLLLEGYSFIQNRCYKYKADIFKTRLLGKTVICITGEDAAKTFYNNRYFERKCVMPKNVQDTLIGKNGVQGLDNKAHRIRKEMFLAIMTPERIEKLIHYTNSQWEANSSKWNHKDIVLFDEAQIILCQASCKWAGIPLYEREAKKRAADLGKMIDGFGSIGMRYWQGRCARKQSENWIRNIITDIRSHKINPPNDSASYIIAWHRDENNRLLDAQVAAVELLNIIRPIVAISTYITFSALAMHKYPIYHRKLTLNNDEYKQMFVQEIRRFYPFTPFVGARIKESFVWKQYYMKKGTLVLLDVYGINHDRSLWSDPYTFYPDRFKNWQDNKFSFIPQGGGDDRDGHRCAGELVTIELMKSSLDFIVNHLSYTVPKQNLRYRLSRIPTLPKSRFVMSDVKRM